MLDLPAGTCKVNWCSYLFACIIFRINEYVNLCRRIQCRLVNFPPKRWGFFSMYVLTEEAPAVLWIQWGSRVLIWVSKPASLPLCAGHQRLPQPSWRPAGLASYIRTHQPAYCEAGVALREWGGWGRGAGDPLNIALKWRFCVILSQFTFFLNYVQHCCLAFPLYFSFILIRAVRKVIILTYAVLSSVRYLFKYIWTVTTNGR